MGKVKGEDNFPDEVAVNRRKKKRRKELDLLRRNVLEAKKKLREKTAPPKTHTSTFDKILNSFADRRQANDNKTQGFDSKGKRAGLKKICNRLLPSRKPQVGIFANGARGAEIKRVNLSLNESDRARFEGDLQKVLGDGKRKCKESKSDVLNETLYRPSAEAVYMEAEKVIRIPEKKSGREPVQNFTTERQNGKRKMQMPIELDGKTAKKIHSEARDIKVEVQYNKVKSEWKNVTETKWKRSLFQNEFDDFEPITEPAVEQLRFSPRIGKAKVKIVQSESNVFLDKADKRPGTKRLNSNYGELGRLAATKYEELCTMVCVDNFDTCLREIPHIDPLTKVKQSLINFYTETCHKKASEKKVRPEVLFAEKSSSTSSYLFHSNIHKNKYSDQNEYLERSKTDRMNLLPPQEACPGNIKNFSHREAPETSSARSGTLVMKASQVNKSNDIPCVTRGPPSSETSTIEHNTSSLDVNYDSSRKSFRSDVLESLNIDEGAEPSADKASPKLTGIPTHRKKTMLRYLEEVNDFQPPKNDGSFCPFGLSTTSTENNYCQKYYISDPLRRHEMRTKQSRNVEKETLADMRGPITFETSIAEQPGNSLDVNCDGVRMCSGLDHGNFPKIDDRAGPRVVNLGSASKSTLARIPSDRGEFMLRYLQEVNNSEPRKEDRAAFRPGVFVVVRENTKLQKHQVGGPLKRHEVRNTSVQDRPGKNERHVPAILRKSQVTKNKKKPNTSGTILAKGVLEIGNLRWKTSDLKFQKMSSSSEATAVNGSSDKRQSLRKPPPTGNPFPIYSDNLTNSERQNPIKKVSHISQFSNRASMPETPTVVRELYELNEKALKIKRNFMDEIFPCKSGIGFQNMAKSSGDGNFPVNFKPQSANICDNLNYTGNFHNSRQFKNSSIFLHQQRPDTRTHRVLRDEDMASSLGDHDSQRFPVFLKRKAAPSTQNGIPHEEHNLQGNLFPEKVIIIQSPRLEGISEDVRREMNVPHMRYRSKDQKLQLNDAGLAFPEYPRAMQMASLKPVELENGRQKIQQFQTPDFSCHNVGQQQVEQLQMPRCGCKTDLQNEQHVRLPRVVYQNGMRKVVNYEYNVQELGNNSMNFFEPTNLDVTTSQRIFQRDSSSNTRIPVSYGSSYCGNTNLESQYRCNSVEPVQLVNKRVGFVLPKNDPQPLCQNANDFPIITHQIRQNHSPVSLEDRNYNYKYNIDPRYPQAGYQWSQIDESGTQITQRIIQPAYNVTDAYRPQLPHSSYFFTDT